MRLSILLLFIPAFGFSQQKIPTGNGHGYVILDSSILAHSNNEINTIASSMLSSGWQLSTTKQLLQLYAVTYSKSQLRSTVLSGQYYSADTLTDNRGYRDLVLLMGAEPVSAAGPVEKFHKLLFVKEY